MDEFSRARLILGDDVDKLANCKVAIFGVGGVGGFVCEALARCNIGNFLLVDSDVVTLTNINRQIIALHSTIGASKVDVMKSRILDINTKASVEIRKEFFLPENSESFDLKGFDYVVDCVDTVTAKLELAKKCERENVPIISCMGTGNKLDPTKLRVGDIFETSVCPLARVMRIECKRRGIKKLKVVYSTELPKKPTGCDEIAAKRSVPGSVSFVPSVAGLLVASEVIKNLIKN